MRKKSKRRWIVLLVVMMAAISAGIFGFLTAREEPRIGQEPSPEPSAVVPAGAENARITAKTNVQWDYEYKRCAHHVYLSCKADESMVGLSFTEFAQQYPFIKIVEFSSDNLVLKRTFDAYCPNHYVLKKSGDELAIYRTAVGTDKQEVYLKIPIDFSEIDPEERKVLEVGKVFGTISDLENYLEDIET